MDKLTTAAARVVQDASRDRPADALLRTVLKASKLTRAESSRVAEMVFAFFRWLPWLNPGQPIEQRLNEALDHDFRFRRQPESFSNADLRRAIPEWASGEITVTPTILRWLQAPPSMWLRARKGTGADIARKLHHTKLCADSTPRPGGYMKPIAMPDCLEYVGREDLFRSTEFQAGAFEIQDIASQIVGLTCNPKPGETWWDACAGEGGKTLHLSDLMGNKGLIWATDRAEWRLKRLKQRAARAGVFNYRAARWDGGEKLPTKTLFDGVLVDAPCSGVGTWQRNPHARWTTTAEDVRELAELQRRLLLHAARAVKPGGRLIYSVCTLTRSESEGVADFCTAELTRFAPLPLPPLPNGDQGGLARQWILPEHFGGNGMFVAAWQCLPAQARS